MQWERARVNLQARPLMGADLMLIPPTSASSRERENSFGYWKLLPPIESGNRNSKIFAKYFDLIGPIEEIS